MVARIEDFEVGQHVSFTKKFTEDDMQRFIEITGDVNPLHVDDEFARKTKFGRRVLQGMLTASIFSTMVGMLMPGTGAIYRSQTIKFLLPVYLGETVTAHFIVRSVDRVKHRLEIDAWSTKRANTSSKGRAKRDCFDDVLRRRSGTSTSGGTCDRCVLEW